MKSELSIAIVGPTGAVGAEFIKLLSNFPQKQNIKLFSARATVGYVGLTKNIVTKSESILETFEWCAPINHVDLENPSDQFINNTIFILCTPSETSEQIHKILSTTTERKYIIDNSSAFRLSENATLAIPNINDINIKNAINSNNKLVTLANPNCSTAIVATSLIGLSKLKIKRLIVSTYQAVSGAGYAGLTTLNDELKSYITNIEEENLNVSCAPLNHGKESPFSCPIALNIIPFIGQITENGYTDEEMKMQNELCRIFSNQFNVSCTCVRVPTRRAHAASVTVQVENSLPNSLEECEKLLVTSPLSILENNQKKLPSCENATGIEPCLVGRVRRSLAFPNDGLDYFISGDQLLRGAALNAYQILLQVLECEAK